MSTSTTTSATTSTTRGMTTEEIAARFRVTAQSVRAWARAGRVPAYRLGSQFRFDLEAVEDALRCRSTADADE